MSSANLIFSPKATDDKTASYQVFMRSETTFLYVTTLQFYISKSCVEPAFTITHHPSPITHHPSPITHHPSPITHHPSPINININININIDIDKHIHRNKRERKTGENNKKNRKKKTLTPISPLLSSKTKKSYVSTMGGWTGHLFLPSILAVRQASRASNQQPGNACGYN
ncbi:hypothetical protein EX30DRAFT_150560 [Ascodesmis nigricans]|uniref:Uncharacterized protein n=1 Tax=Ascodesmis nigricans TaxID=341454 RepID=A0A4S2N234_9PEZI|nr:hypothetical protein EX30DRAFT_150560 [Ascodesmis nigricans]